MPHRYKTYAGETGITYQYFYQGKRRTRRPREMGVGTDFTFVVTADQHPPLPLKVFLADRALQCWREAHGRELDSTEQYAAAKMRLFRAFDDLESLSEERFNIVVDETNLEELLEPLDLA